MSVTRPATPLASIGVPEAKGHSFYNIVDSLQRLRGDAAVAKLRAQAAPHVLELLENRTFVSVGWYPLVWYRDLVTSALRAADEGVLFARELGRDGTAADFRGIYRLLKFVLSPQALLQRAPAVYDRYRRPGRLVVEEAQTGYSRVRFEGCVGYDEALWQVAIGSCVGVLEVCGAKNIRVKILTGGRDGSVDTTAEGRWL